MQSFWLAMGLALAAQSSAQDVVVPANAAAQDGGSNCDVAGFTGRYRQQVLIGPTLLGAVANRTIASLSFRRDGAQPALVGGLAHVKVTMGEASIPRVGAASMRFADNFGPFARVVFDGIVVLPAAPRLLDRNAATWSSPDAVTLSAAEPQPTRRQGGRSAARPRVVSRKS